MNNTRRWYLILYDIRSASRLQRVHRLLKSCAIALQESVFAWNGTDSELTELQSSLKKIINNQEDEICGYAIHSPLLLVGASPFMSDIYFDGYPPHQHHPNSWLESPEGLNSCS